MWTCTKHWISSHFGFFVLKVVKHCFQDLRYLTFLKTNFMVKISKKFKYLIEFRFNQVQQTTVVLVKDLGGYASMVRTFGLNINDKRPPT